MNTQATASLFTWTPSPSLSQWMTPEWAAELIVERYFGDLGRSDMVLEPSCGRGAFLKAVPDSVQAVGVEIDPVLAEEARDNTGRPVYVGDFRTIKLKEQPTLIVGNPPFRVKIISEFLERAAKLLPDEAKCGFLLPAYAMQTHRTVMRWAETWSMHAELVPRRLFPRLSLPLLFVQFRKAANGLVGAGHWGVRTMVGFTLYPESVDVEGMRQTIKETLANGKPRQSAWMAVVQAVLVELGGEATLEEIYGAVQPRRPTGNPWWREKVRQTLQRGGDRGQFTAVDRGRWALGGHARKCA